MENEAPILKQIADGRQPPPPLHSEELLARLNSHFDVVRNPDLEAVYTEVYVLGLLTALSLGAVRDKYFISPNGSIDWNRVVEAVSR